MTISLNNTAWPGTPVRFIVRLRDAACHCTTCITVTRLIDVNEIRTKTFNLDNALIYLLYIHSDTYVYLYITKYSS